MRLSIYRDSKLIHAYDDLDAEGVREAVWDELQLYAFMAGEPEPSAEDVDDQVAALLGSQAAGVRPFMRLDAGHTPPTERVTAYLSEQKVLA